MTGTSAVHDCRFCDYAAGDLPADAPIVFSNERWVVSVSENAPVPGWVLLWTREHRERLSGLSETEAAEFGTIGAHVSRSIEHCTGAPVVYTVGFMEFHPHFHVLFAARSPEVPPEDRGANFVLRSSRYRNVPDAIETGHRIGAELQRRLDATV